MSKQPNRHKLKKPWWVMGGMFAGDAKSFCWAKFRTRAHAESWIEKEQSHWWRMKERNLHVEYHGR